MIIIQHEDQKWEEWRPGVRTRCWSNAHEGANNLMVAEQIFQPGTEAPTHWHYVEEHVSFLSGSCEVWCDGVRTQVQSAATIIFPPRSKHGFVNNGDEELHVVGSLSLPYMEVYFEHDPDGVVTREYEADGDGSPRKLHPMSVEALGTIIAP